MKYYMNNYKAKRLKLPRRLVFFAVIALLILLFALLLGSHLKKRLEEADIDTTPISEAATTPEDGNAAEPGGGAQHDNALLNVCAGNLSLDGSCDQTAAFGRIAELKAAGFNCVSFTAADENGVRYMSPAAQQLSRLPASTALVSYDLLSAAVTYAKQQGMRTSAVFLRGNDTADMLITAELAGMGFDEIIIRGFEGILGENGGDINAASDYLKNIRAVKGEADISVVLQPDAYIYARNSLLIEKLYTYTEFLTIDLRAVGGERAAEIAERLSGSFTAYLLRAQLNASDEDTARVLREREVGCLHFVTSEEKPADTSAKE